jgi:predicted peroxiredoxin
VIHLKVLLVRFLFYRKKKKKKKHLALVEPLFNAIQPLKQEGIEFFVFL